MFTLAALVQAVIWLIIAGLIVWLLYWLISYCNVPEPFNKVARIVLAVFSVIVVICILLELGGHRIIVP